MILREGVNSPLMKFAEDIKLEGVVNTNEDSKTVQRDLGGKLGRKQSLRGGKQGDGQHLGLPGEPGKGKGIPGLCGARSGHG